MTRPIDSAKRKESFAVYLLDDNGEPDRLLHPEPITVNHSSAGTIGRAVPRLALDPTEATWITRDSRIKPIITVNGVDYGAGVYVPTGRTWLTTDTGKWGEFQLHDLAFLLYSDVKLTDAYGITSGTALLTAVEELVDLAGITGAALVDTAQTVGNHLGWPKGTPIGDVLTDLARTAGLTRPWFDRDGTLHMSFLPYASGDAPHPTFKVRAGRKSPIGAEGVQENDDYWLADNEWEVVSQGATTIYVGSFALPASHEFSVANGNRRRVKRVEIPGLTSNEEAAARAMDEAQRDTTVNRTMTCMARPDPTCELHNVVETDEGPMLLDEWSYEFKAGTDTRHTLRTSVEAA